MAEEPDRASAHEHGPAAARHSAGNGRAKVWIVAVVALLLIAWGAHWGYQRWTQVVQGWLREAPTPAQPPAPGNALRGHLDRISSLSN